MIRGTGVAPLNAVEGVRRGFLIAGAVPGAVAEGGVAVCVLETPVAGAAVLPAVARAGVPEAVAAGVVVPGDVVCGPGCGLGFGRGARRTIGAGAWVSCCA